MIDIIDSNLKFNSILETREYTTHIVLHHAKWKECTVEDIHRIHINERKWFGIGYHYFVRKNGKVYTGRHIQSIGAHCYGCNDYSIGICFEGDYEEEKEMPREQIFAGQQLLELIKNAYGVLVVATHGAMPDQATKCAGKYFAFDEITNPPNVFMDINNHWAKDNIVVAQRLGLIAGYEDGTFRPDEKITRAECVTLMMQMYKKIRGV